MKLALDLGNDINAKTHLGDYPMTGTSESMLAHYPDNFDDLANLGVGDPRWDGMTALHGAVICNQPSILQYLVDHGADAECQEQARLDAVDHHPGHLHGELEERIPGGRGNPQEGDGSKGPGRQPGIIAANRQYFAQSRSKRNTSFAGGSGACVSIHRTGSEPAFSKLWMQPTPVQITSPGPRS